jgi:hypothetical protein
MNLRKIGAEKRKLVATVSRTQLPPQERRGEGRIVDVYLDILWHQLGMNWYKI